MVCKCHLRSHCGFLETQKHGIQIESVTCDGAANILKAVREVCPEAVLQRCTAHIALWITRKPKSKSKSDAAHKPLEWCSC